MNGAAQGWGKTIPLCFFGVGGAAQWWETCFFLGGGWGFSVWERHPPFVFLEASGAAHWGETQPPIIFLVGGGGGLGWPVMEESIRRWVGLPTNTNSKGIPPLLLLGWVGLSSDDGKRIPPFAFFGLGGQSGGTHWWEKPFVVVGGADHWWETEHKIYVTYVSIRTIPQ